MHQPEALPEGKGKNKGKSKVHSKVVGPSGEGNPESFTSEELAGWSARPGNKSREKETLEVGGRRDWVVVADEATTGEKPQKNIEGSNTTERQPGSQKTVGISIPGGKLNKKIDLLAVVDSEGNVSFSSQQYQFEGEIELSEDLTKDFDEATVGEATVYNPPHIERIAAGTMSVYIEKPTDKDPGKKIERLSRSGRRFANVPFEIQ